MKILKAVATPAVPAETRWLSPCGRWAVRLSHLAVGGRRFWAYNRHTGGDHEHGLDPAGYATMQDAKAAVAKVAGEPRWV